MKKALDEGKVNQVVILGAGFDTRAYRFADRLRNVRVFEVDAETTQKVKKSVIYEHVAESERNHVTFVCINFEVQTLEDVLIQAGYQKVPLE